MILFPIVERELRLAARRPSTYLGRCIAAGLAIVALAVLVIGLSGDMRPVRVAQIAFQTLAIGSYIIVLFAGVFLTADCVSEEKREGTLGLLFLTDLKGWDVVLGKLASTSILGIYGLVAILPVLSIPVMFGGVTFLQFLQLGCSLLLSLGVSLSMGLLVSVLGREARTVFGAALFLVVVMGFGFELLRQGLQELGFAAGVGSPFLEAMQYVSPGGLVGLAASDFSGGFRFGRPILGMDPFWFGVLVQVGWIAGLLGAASVALPRCWSESGMVGKKREVLKWDTLFFWENGFGIRGARTQTLRVALVENPYRWLVLRTMGHDQWSTLLMVVCGFGFGVMYMAGINTRSHGYFATAMFFAFGLHLLAKIQMALWCVRRLCEDRASGAMELLMVTPLAPGQMLRGVREAMKVRWKVPIRWLMLMNVLLMMAAVSTTLFNGDDVWIFCQFFLGGMGLLLMDFHLLTRVGCSMALKHAKPQKAALAALGWVMVPGILGLLLMAVMLIGLNGGGNVMIALHFGWVVWCLLAAMIVHRRFTTELSHFEGVRTSRFLDPVGQSGIHPVPGRTPVTEPTGN